MQWQYSYFLKNKNNIENVFRTMCEKTNAICILSAPAAIMFFHTNVHL